MFICGARDVLYTHSVDLRHPRVHIARQLPSGGVFVSDVWLVHNSSHVSRVVHIQRALNGVHMPNSAQSVRRNYMYRHIISFGGIFVLLLCTCK